MLTGVHQAAEIFEMAIDWNIRMMDKFNGRDSVGVVVVGWPQLSVGLRRYINGNAVTRDTMKEVCASASVCVCV